MKLIIFGNGHFSSLAWYLFTHDSEHEVAGFTVDAAYLGGMETLHELPVAPFESIAERYPPERYLLSIPIGFARMNGVRAERFAAAKTMGYRFASYVSSRAMVWPDLAIGENCMIHDGAIIQPFARIGDNCCVRSGAHLSHHSTLGDHCFVASHAVIAGNVDVGERCVIGLNATVRNDLTLAPRCFIGAGAVLTCDTTPDGTYVGIPAKRTTKA